MQDLQLLVGGLAQGCIYGLVAFGFVLIYKATETVNFAQGELMMIGAFVGLSATVALGLSFWFAVLAACAVTALLGLAVERAVLRPMLGQPTFSIVLVTIGLGYMARGIVTMVPGFGSDTHAIPTNFGGKVVDAGIVIASVEHLVVIAATILLCLLLFALFRYTRIGIAMQAMSQNQLAANYVGIPVKQLSGWVWALGAGIAAIAGMLLAPLTFVHANMGLIGLKAFPAAVIGGFASLPGALVGGVIIGVVEAFAGFYLVEGLNNIAAYIIVLLVLILKPTGLFGETSRKKV